MLKRIHICPRFYFYFLMHLSKGVSGKLQTEDLDCERVTDLLARIKVLRCEAKLI